VRRCAPTSTAQPLAVSLSSHPALVQALLYLTLIGKGAGQIQGVFNTMRLAWSSLAGALAKLTGGRISLGGQMTTAGDTMLTAARQMQAAADTMVGASRGAGAAAGAEGAAGGAAAGAAGRGGLISSLLRIGGKGLAEIGLPVWLSSKIKLPGFDKSVLAADVQSFKDLFVTPITKAWTAIGGRSLVASFQADWDAVLASAQAFGHDLASAFTTHGAVNQQMLKIGGDIVHGLWNGIKGAWNAFWGWFRQLPGRIISLFTAAFGISSPSRVMVGIGHDIVTGLWNGMRAAWSLAWAWIRRIPGWITGVFAGAGRWLVDEGQRLIGGLWNGIRAVWARVGAWLGGAKAWFEGKFASAGRWLWNRGAQVISGLWAGMKSVWNRVTNWLSSLAGKIKDLKGPVSADAQLLVPAGRAIMKGLHTGLLLGAGGPLGFLSGMAGTIGDLLSGGLRNLLNGMGGAGVGGGVTRWSGLVLQVLRMLGQSASWLPVVLRRMNQESGGNPRAINLWDSNARAGYPSMGLMQTIPQTFAAYAGPFRGLGIWNPLANIYAGLNYALHRYGTLAALSQPGGYAEGGPITEPMIGIGLRSRRPFTFGEAGPEYVSSQADMADVARLLAAVLRELRQINGHTRTGPERTGVATAKALDGSTRRVALGRS